MRDVEYTGVQRVAGRRGLWDIMLTGRVRRQRREAERVEGERCSPHSRARPGPESVTGALFLALVRSVRGGGGVDG